MEYKSISKKYMEYKVKGEVIDVCNIKTYPSQLIDAFCKNESEESIFKLIENHYLVCFHYTRLYDEKLIKQEGIKPFDKDIIQYVIDVYQKEYNNNEECDLIKEAVNEHIKNYDYNDRGTIKNTKLKKLCFVAGFSDKTKEYSKYYSMFGGECISNATKKYAFHDKLINIGENYCIKFIIPITYLSHVKSGTQINSLIYIMKENYFENKSKPFDGYLYEIAIEPRLIKSIDKI